MGLRVRVLAKERYLQLDLLGLNDRAARLAKVRARATTRARARVRVGVRVRTTAPRAAPGETRQCGGVAHLVRVRVRARARLVRVRVRARARARVRVRVAAWRTWLGRGPG